MNDQSMVLSEFEPGAVIGDGSTILKHMAIIGSVAATYYLLFILVQKLADFT